MKITQQYAEKIRQPLNNRMRNYTGSVIGRLTMLYPTNERIGHGAVKWAAICDCGCYALVNPSNKSASSCGCLKIETSSLDVKETKRALNDNEVRAIKKGFMNLVNCAAVFGVSVSTISKIRNGKSYANVQ